ncbi:AP-1 complex subunit sigma-3 [Phoenicopterus ruber ruber]
MHMAVTMVRHPSCESLASKHGCLILLEEGLGPSSHHCEVVMLLLLPGEVAEQEAKLLFAQGKGGQIHFILLFSRQGKLRLQKWYTTLPDKEKKKIIREIVQIILSRNQKTSSFVDWKDLKLVYKRYASLYFCCAIEDQDNELLTLEVVHRYVELLDRYFGNVCELDIIFNFEKAYFILDEFIIGGEVQETSKRSAVKAIEDSDMLQETVEEYMNKPAF